MKRILLTLTMLCALFYNVFAQARVVAGKITDDKGNAVSGATVNEVGTSNAVQADANGNFSISIRPNSSLAITAVGFQTQTVRPGSNSVSISLLRSDAQLQEVVVTALGQSRSKAKVGYATSSFNNEAITRNAPVGVLDNLAGKVAGAEISQIGGPGSSNKVVLRGYGVIAGGSNQPLYVVDGIPLNDARFGATSPFSNTGNLDFGNSANDINPNDIENITILKGTAATSLYGSNARNGVIMITTKRGRSGKLRVEYSGSANFSSVGKLPDFQDQFGQGWSGTFILSENGSWGPRLDGKDRLWGAVVDNSQLLKPFSFIKNNMRDFYDIGTEYNNTVSLSGGNETNQFYFSYGNVTSDGILPSTSDFLERNTFALRTNSRFNNFSINTSFNYINRKVNSPFSGQGTSSGSTSFENILQIPVDIPIKDFRDYKNKWFNIDNYFTPYAENPYYPLFENGNTQNSDRFFGSLDLGYKFSNSFSAQLRTGIDFSNARTFGFAAVNAPKPGSWDAGNNVENAPKNPDVGSVSELTNYIGTINGDFILKYNKNIGSFSLEALAGMNYFQQDTKGVSATVTNLVIPGFYNLSNSTNKPTASDARSRKRLIGAYAQAVLGYRDQLYLTVNARNDWSSTLPIDHNAFFYPGANLSWIASQTLHLDGTSISLLKLRAGYGQTGIDAPLYDVYPVLTLGNVALPFGSINFPFNGVSGFGVANTIGNLNLQPIITTEAELGAEIRFFKNRLGLDVALYDKRTKGQIFTVPISPSTGYTGLVENLGLVQNRGIELTFDAKPVNTRDFTWALTYTFSKNWNKVLNLTGGPNKVIINSVYDVEQNAIPGKSVFGLYAPVPSFTSDGKTIVSPATGLPIPAADKGFYGDAEYDYMMGMSNTVTYKNWSLGFSLDYRVGGVMYSGTSDLALFTGNSYVTTYNDRRPFILPNSVVQNGVDANGKPVYVENTTAIMETNYDAFWYPTSNLAMSYKNRIIDRSFLKLRDVSLTYRLPQNWASKIRANNLSVSVYARNILLWTPSSNIYLDPEASNFSNDLTSQLGEFRTAPTSKTFGVALKATF